MTTNDAEPGDEIVNHRKRLIYRSWHRGTREMDLLLGSFADRHVPAFDAGMLDDYEALLQTGDPDLYDWVARRIAPPAHVHNAVLDLLLAHSFA